MSVDLEKFCVIQPYESAWLAPYDGKWQQVGPSRSRKPYPQSKRSRRIYMGAGAELGDDFKPVKEITKLLDKRPLSELEEQAQDALKQMLYRAHCGDHRAMLQYIFISQATVSSLQTLAKQQPVKMRAIAETLSDWPVLLSLNPQDIAAAEQQLKDLGVGTMSPLPTRRGQRLDRRNFWTRLATQALKACVENKRLVPALKAMASGATRKRKTLKLWERTTSKATFYFLSSGDIVIIPDWQNRCVKLSGPITKENFAQWWHVVKWCALEHWKNPVGSYAQALRKIGRANEEEGLRRNLAIDRVEQALRSLVGLQ